MRVAAKADAVVAAIKKLTEQPIRYVIDTSADPDHVGGNETRREGRPDALQPEQRHRERA